ncbi:hypothetical protein K7X08_026279 [Anisodus acutangulus]|uniref:Uncharacterized protein n=1 Tax=Anisodus acutangulus TaxID=402998 RepID=A0A9Q1RUZ8_9SOLA|nr:hypothetical protein K7X08_026279 [Anisodus acutangulus]
MERNSSKFIDGKPINDIVEDKGVPIQNKFTALEEESPSIKKKSVNTERENEQQKEDHHVSLGDTTAKDSTNIVVMCNMPNNAPITLLKKNSPIRSLHDLVSHNIPVEDGSKLIDDQQEAISVDEEELIKDKL